MISGQELMLAVLGGIFATWIMDRGAIFGRKSGRFHGVEPEWLGRWVLGFRHGRFVRESIFSPSEYGERLERRVSLLTHYLIGIALAVAFAFLTQSAVSSAAESITNSVILAIAYGVATTAFAWFLLFPAIGLGWFGSKAPRKYLLLRTSVYNHFVYGVGLAVFAAVLSWWV